MVGFYKNDIFLLSNYEKLPEGADLLKPFFWTFNCHDPEPSRLEMINYKEGAFFYCYYLPSPRELREYSFEVEIINLYLPKEVEISSVFFDVKNDMDVDLSKLHPQKVVYIYVNDQKAGIYFEKNRLLIASDWTHNDKCIQMLKYLLPQLSKCLKKRSKKTPKINFKLTLGADPEFELIDLYSHKIIPASRIIMGGTSTSHQIGLDGAGHQVEIRPTPSSDIKKFIKNFRNILIQFSEEYPNYSLSAQGDRYPLGGHIHLGIPPSKEIVTLLDNWIGERVLDLSGLARGSYKKMGAIEHKPWGFEYRTPPASIFLKPSVLKAVLRIIKKIINAYYSKGGVALAPNDDEIKRLGLNKEWQILNDFIARYPKLSKDILKNWRIRVLSDQYINIVCKDDWKEDVMVFVKDLLHKKLSKTLIKKLNDKNIHKIIFFGLKKERGEVCNFPNKLFSTIEYNYPTENSVAFGFPYSIRMPEVLTDEIRKKWNILVDDIMKELHYAVK